MKSAVATYSKFESIQNAVSGIVDKYASPIFNIISLFIIISLILGINLIIIK